MQCRTGCLLTDRSGPFAGGWHGSRPYGGLAGLHQRILDGGHQIVFQQQDHFFRGGLDGTGVALDGVLAEARAHLGGAVTHSDALRGAEVAAGDVYPQNSLPVLALVGAHIQAGEPAFLIEEPTLLAVV